MTETTTPAPALTGLPEEIIDALVLEFGRICYERTRCQGMLVCSSCPPWEALSEESRRSWAETWPAEPLREAARTVLTAALSQGAADAARLDWLEADIRERGPLLLHDGSATGHRGLGLLGRTLREAVDGSLRSRSTDAAHAGEASHG